MKHLLLAATAIPALALPAQAGAVFIDGSSFTIIGQNTPGTLATGALITPGIQQQLITVTGPLFLTVGETPDGAGGEWISFSYSANQMVGNIINDWNLNEVGLQTNTASNHVGSFISFDANGVTQAPTGNCGIFGGNFQVGASPVPGSGTGCLATGFSDSFAAGPLPSFGTNINPFSFLAVTGINPNIVNSYFQALDFRPQSVTPPGVPEPSTLALLAAGVLGLGLMRVKWRS